MPNHITTRISINGPTEDIKKFRELAIQQVPEEVRRAFDNKIICINNEGSSYGWYNEETDEFSFRDSDQKNIITVPGGVPDNYSYDMIEAHERFDFDKIVPMPDDVKASIDVPLTMEVQAASKGRNWLDWSNKNWGTKWNAYEFDIQAESPTFIQFTFQTAWNFPEPVVKQLTKLFPSLVITADTIDEGWNFWGTATFTGGECTHDGIQSSFDKQNPVFRTMVKELLNYDMDEDGDEDEEDED